MGSLTAMEEFKRKKNLRVTRQPAKVHKLPERPIMVKQIWICGHCHEENEDDKCWKCGRERVLG